MSKIIVSSTEKTVTIQQTGQPGPGVASGGTAGQVLAKASGTDYDTEWIDNTGGGGGSATFIGLTDTPGAFVASRIVSVNAAGDALEFPSASDARTLLGLGTAATASSGDFATAAQGSLADSAVQPGDLAGVATSGDYGDLLNLPTLFSGAYGDLTGVPATFPPAAHTHTLSAITDAGTAAAADTGDFDASGSAAAAVSAHAGTTTGVHGISAFGATLVDDANAAAARTTLGLGTAATANTGAFATSAQGALADSAVQPGDLAAVATSGDYDDLSNLPALFDGAYSSLSGIPSTFAPSAHTHTASQVTDFATAADARIGAASLGDLANVNLAGLTAGKILEYNGSAFVLIDTPSGGGGSTTLGGLSDVTITGPLGTTDVLAWNGSNWADVDVNSLIGSYLAGIAVLGNLSDVTVSSASTGEVIRWNGSLWVNAQLAYTDLSGTPTLATVATSGDYDDLTNKPTLFDGAYSSLSGIPSTFTPSSHNLTSHSDVSTSLTTDGNFLKYSGGAWRNANIGSADVPNLDTSKITTGTFADARISEASVTQHEAALTIDSSQLTGTLSDARVAESNVTQHEAALDILGSQVSGKAGPGASFDGGGAAIADDVIVRSPVTEAGTVSTVYAVADQSGSVSVIVRHYAAADTSFASPTSLGTLSISTAQVGTLGSLSQAVAVGDVLEFEIDGAATNIERLAVRARI